MTRAQCIVHREDKLLMVQHHHKGVTWWCLPGGGVEPGETPAEAAIRELQEECCANGAILRQTSCWTDPERETVTFLVEIGDQAPRMGNHPDDPCLTDMRWLKLSEIPARDRTFLWAAGLLGVGAFWPEVSAWGDRMAYPGAPEPLPD
jgi:ADP-ribose pyrophosphatase YjhB (NUDIX family)